MTHKMILATADLSKIYKVVVARRKNAGRVSTEASTSDSYPENSSSNLELGSTSIYTSGSNVDIMES